MAKKKEKKKKPFYRRWWFIVIAIFFILFMIGSMADPPEESAEKAEDKPKVEAKKEDKTEAPKDEKKEAKEVSKVDKADKKEETKSKEDKKEVAKKDEKKSEEVKAKEEKPKEEKPKKAEAKPKQPASLDDKIKKTIAKVDSKETLSDLQVNDNYGVDVEGAKLAIVTFKDEVGLSAKMTKKIFLSDSAKLFERLFEKHPELHSVTLKWELPLTDAYGNSEHSEVLRIELDRATAEKINWAAFDTKNYETVAMQYFEHPAFNR